MCTLRIFNLVSLLLVTIHNNSLTTCCYTNALKTARVVPIFKAGGRSNLNYYHSLSILRPIIGEYYK